MPLSSNSQLLQGFGSITLSIAYSENTRKNHWFQIERHCHDCCEIYVNLSGDVSFMVEDTLYPVSHGDVILTKPWENHHCVYRSERLHKHYWLLFSTDTPTLFPHFFDRASGQGNLISLLPDKKEELIAICRSLMENTDNRLRRYADFFALQQLLAYGAVNFPASPDSLPPELSAMLAYASSVELRTLTAASLAESGHVSISTAERLFRAYTGTTPSRFITEKRLDKARRLLKNGKNVTEAALESGFCDSSYFILQFRKRYGITPHQFRKMP